LPDPIRCPEVTEPVAAASAEAILVVLQAAVKMIGMQSDARAMMFFTIFEPLSLWEARK
jgi:hypothetical protein